MDLSDNLGCTPNNWATMDTKLESVESRNKYVRENLKWSEKKYSIGELIERGGWPKVIIPESGWCGDAESVSFCGDQMHVGLGIRSFRRLKACHFGVYCQGPLEVVKSIAEPEFIIPIQTIGEMYRGSRVTIKPIRKLETVYPTMKELWSYHPRFAKVTKKITIDKNIIEEDTIIELLKGEGKYICCQIKGRVPKTTITIPLDTEGNFTIVPDETEYSLKDLCDWFTFPQRVLFTAKPSNLNHTDVLLLGETTHDVVVSCPIESLFQNMERNNRYSYDKWGRDEENFMDANFVFLPRPINEQSPTYNIGFDEWCFDPDSDICREIQKRAAQFEIERFNDFNQVLPVESLEHCDTDNNYCYVSLDEFRFCETKKDDPKNSKPASVNTVAKNEYTEDLTSQTDEKPSKHGTFETVAKNEYTEDPTSPTDEKPSKHGSIGRKISDTLKKLKKSSKDIEQVFQVGAKENPVKTRQPAPTPPGAKHSIVPLEGAEAPPPKPPPRPPKSSKGNRSASVSSGADDSNSDSGPLSIKFPPPEGKLTPFKDLTFEQLASIFEFFRLDKLANMLRDNKVDGAFFIEKMDDDDFLGEPFNATKFNLKRIQQIREGVYPK